MASAQKMNFVWYDPRYVWKWPHNDWMIWFSEPPHHFPPRPGSRLDPAWDSVSVPQLHVPSIRTQLLISLAVSTSSGGSYESLFLAFRGSPIYSSHYIYQLINLGLRRSPHRCLCFCANSFTNYLAILLNRGVCWKNWIIRKNYCKNIYRVMGTQLSNWLKIIKSMY